MLKFRNKLTIFCSVEYALPCNKTRHYGVFFFFSLHFSVRSAELTFIKILSLEFFFLSSSYDFLKVSVLPKRYYCDFLNFIGVLMFLKTCSHPSIAQEFLLLMKKKLFISSSTETKESLCILFWYSFFSNSYNSLVVSSSLCCSTNSTTSSRHTCSSMELAWDTLSSIIEDINSMSLLVTAYEQNFSKQSSLFCGKFPAKHCQWH